MKKKDNFFKSCRFAELIYKAAQFQTFCDYRKTTIKLLLLQKQYYCKYELKWDILHNCKSTIKTNTPILTSLVNIKRFHFWLTPHFHSEHIEVTAFPFQFDYPHNPTSILSSVPFAACIWAHFSWRSPTSHRSCQTLLSCHRQTEFWSRRRTPHLGWFCTFLQASLWSLSWGLLLCLDAGHLQPETTIKTWLSKLTKSAH